MLDLLQEIFTLSVCAVRIEITKRVEMRRVLGFVAPFLPTRLVVCASGPLVNAALDLMTTYATRQNSDSRVRARRCNPYYREYKGNSFKWDGLKIFMKDNADIVLVLEPRDIDNFLDYGVLIWVMWAPARIELL